MSLLRRQTIETRLTRRFVPSEALTRLGVDRAVVYAVLGNLVSFACGPLTAWLIATRFSPELQGYYYTFSGLLVVKYLAELGLGQAIIQFASHEWANLHFNPDGRIAGDWHALSRLRSLARLSMKWYGLAGLAMGPVLFLSGSALFARASAHETMWLPPWLALCVATGLGFAILPLFSLLQGCNQTSQFWFYRFVQQIVNSFALWAAILAGAGLWTNSIAMTCGMAWGIGYLGLRHRGFVTSLLLSPPEISRINWLTEIWPIQWRIAISWFSATFTSQLFVPLTFAVLGPVVAGQMGMTITLSSVIFAVSTNLVVTKAPIFGLLIASNRLRDLDHLFFSALAVLTAVALVGAITATVGVIALHSLQSPLAARILPPVPAGMLLAATVPSAFVTALSTYLRAHKREPLAWTYLASSITTGGLAMLLISRFGAMGVATGQLATLGLLQLPLAVLIFRRCRIVWHQPAGITTA